MDNIIKALTKPKKIYSCEEFFSLPKDDLEKAGLYAWYFKKDSLPVLTDKCIVQKDKTLLYVGSSSFGENASLYKRIEKHYTKNANVSTLRMSLGVLLYEASSFPLRKLSRTSKKFKFCKCGKKWLSDWMEKNAFVCWIAHEDYKNAEKEVIKSISLPLNLTYNKRHPFYKSLKEKRKVAKDNARKLAPLK